MLYVDEFGIVEMFLKMKTIVVKGKQIKKTELYKAYKAFITKYEFEGVNERAFVRLMRHFGIKEMRNATGLYYSDISIVD